MSSKRELREQMALLRGDVEAWRAAADRIGKHRDAAIWERDEARAERDQARTELADAQRRLTSACAAADEWKGEAMSRLDLLKAACVERDAAIAERDQARADLAQARLDLLDPTPEPRPFRVGDRVRVAEGATYLVYDGQRDLSSGAGREGRIVEVFDDGDIGFRVDGDTYVCVASPEFCTLIEPEPEPEPFDYPAAIEQATADLAVEPRMLTITVPAGVAIEWSIR